MSAKFTPRALKGIVILIVLIGSWGVATWGQVCPEGPPRCPYASIQKALDAGLSEVLIAPGTYTELVTIRHSATLQGLDRDKVILIGAIRTEGEGFSVGISGMTIRQGFAVGWNEGIALRRVSATVQDVVITQLEGFHAGIWVDDPTGDVLIRRVEIKDNIRPDPFLKLRIENRQSGIGGIVLSQLRPGRTITLKENKIINNGFFQCEPRVFTCTNPPPANCPVLRRSFVFAHVKELADVTKADGTLAEASHQALRWIPAALKHVEGHSKDWDARYLTPLERAGTQLHCLGVRGVPCVPLVKTAGAFNLVGTFFTNEAMKNFTAWVKALRDEKAVKDELQTKGKIGALLPTWKDNKKQVFFACFDTAAKAGEFKKCTSTERITEESAARVACQFFDLKLEKGECKPKPIDWSKL
ncbi:MAG: hypothetical protein ACK4HB_05995 [Candidatus Bipolaricaulia bacterium]